MRVLFLAGLALGVQGATGALAEPRTRVQVALVSVGGTGGSTFGCGDALVREWRTVPFTRAPLRAALTELLAGRTSSPGRMNALARSSLTVGRIEVRGGRAIVDLRGQLRLNGVCDAPRVAAQLQATATQFPAVRDACFFVNGVPLEGALSESGLPIRRDVCTSRPVPAERR